MWSLLSRKIQLTIIVAAGIAVAWSADAAMAYFSGHSMPFYKCVSVAVLVVGGALTFIAEKSWRWFWKTFPVLQTMIFPDFNGVWKGTLISTWVNPETQKGIPPIQTVVTIRHGIFSTSVSLQTGESTSHSTRAFLEPFPETRRYRIWYSYNNDPLAQVRRRSSAHEGVAYLEMNYDTDPSRLTGSYYTERKTSGDLDLTR